MKQYKPRDKVTQKITREGAVEENQTTGKSENISGKEKEADFSGRLHFTEEDRAGTGPLYPQSGTGGR